MGWRAWLLALLLVLTSSQEEIKDLQDLLDSITPEPDEPPRHSTLVALDSTTFPRVTKGKWLVLFYAPWCSRSKQALSTLGHLAPSLKQKGFSVAQVDASQYEDLANRFFVLSFPTLKMFMDGMVYPYDGSPTKPAILDYIRSGWKKKVPLKCELDPSPLVKLTEEQFEQVATGEPRWLVMFYAPWCLMSQAFLPYYDSWAASLATQGVQVALFDGSTSEQSDRFEVRGFPTIFLIGGGKYREFTGNRSLEALRDFVTAGLQAAPVVPAPRWWVWKALEGGLRLASELGSELARDAEELLQNKRNASAAVFVLGLCAGALLWKGLFACCRRSPKARKDAPRVKGQPAAAAATDADSASSKKQKAS